MKHHVVSLKRDMKDLYKEIYKLMMKEIKEVYRRWKYLIILDW
jgi:hypothetical protein